MCRSIPCRSLKFGSGILRAKGAWNKNCCCSMTDSSSWMSPSGDPEPSIVCPSEHRHLGAYHARMPLSIGCSRPGRPLHLRSGEGGEVGGGGEVPQGLVRP